MPQTALVRNRKLTLTHVEYLALTLPLKPTHNSVGPYSRLPSVLLIRHLFFGARWPRLVASSGRGRTTPKVCGFAETGNNLFLQSMLVASTFLARVETKSFLVAVSCLDVRSAALGRIWPENGRAGGGRRLVNASGVVRTPKGVPVHRIPRFPPLADQVGY